MALSCELTAYLNGIRVGWFTQQNGGAITLEYDREWQNRSNRMELSWSLPKSRRQHTGTAPGNYLWNLLPDSTEVLERWGRRFSVSPRNPLALLANVGVDTAGAVQLLASDDYDEPILSGEGAIAPIDEAGIAAHLRELRRDPSAWVAHGYEGGYFSLAGAQSKFTLVRTPQGWGIPTGRAASTHIVKPGVTGLTRSDLNEHLTMRAAHFLDVPVRVRSCTGGAETCERHLPLFTTSAPRWRTRRSTTAGPSGRCRTTATIGCSRSSRNTSCGRPSRWGSPRRG